MKSILNNTRTRQSIARHITREIGVSHGRFISKLYNSITLSFRDVNRFVCYVNFGPKLMFSQVAKEIEEDKELESELK